MNKDLIELPAIEISKRIRQRDLSATEVVSTFLERIETLNPKINAVVQLDAENALAQAQEADKAIERGDIWGPFHGVPFTAKDIFDTAGIISAAGLEERANHVPEQDAVVISRMKAAGAILLGKTNVPPMGGGGECENPVYGRTNNPYDLTRTPGGSSGGEAAILTAGGSPLGIGSDSGGSLRLPAHYCGVATLKPTVGRIPSTGAYMLPGGLSDPRSQIGPMSRFVTDLWTAFSVIAGPDWQDSAVIPIPLGDPSAVRIGTLRVAYYTNDGQAQPTDETEEMVRICAAALAKHGMAVQEARPEHIQDARAVTEQYWAWDRGEGVDTETLFSNWDKFRSDMLGFMRHYNVLICPADARPAHRHGEELPWKFNYTIPFSLTGWPCVVLRAGTSSEGLPIGVQVVARPWREDVAIAVSGVIEKALGGWQKPPLF